MSGQNSSAVAGSTSAAGNNQASLSSRFHLRDRLRGVALIAIIVTTGMWTYPPVLAFIIVGCCADEYFRMISKQILNLHSYTFPSSSTLSSPPTSPDPTPIVLNFTGRVAYVSMCVLIAVSALWSLQVLTLTTLIFSFLLLIYLFFLHVQMQPLLANANQHDAKESKLFLHPSPVHSAHIFLSVILHIFGLWYSAWLFSHAALILQHVTSLTTGLGVRRLVFVIVVTAAGENGGMFLGAAFGTTKCTPHISPNKTKIGAWAQVLVAGLTSAAIYLYAPWLEPRICSSVQEAAGLGLALGVIGGMGDLFESFLKRSVGVKDAGSLIPGAGGMLDRMDGLVFNFPFVYYYLEYRSHLL